MKCATIRWTSGMCVAMSSAVGFVSVFGRAVSIQSSGQSSSTRRATSRRMECRDLRQIVASSRRPRSQLRGARSARARRASCRWRSEDVDGPERAFGAAVGLEGLGLGLGLGRRRRVVGGGGSSAGARVGDATSSASPIAMARVLIAASAHRRRGDGAASDRGRAGSRRWRASSMPPRGADDQRAGPTARSTSSADFAAWDWSSTRRSCASTYEA